MNGDGKEIKLPKLVSMEKVEEKEAEWLISGYIPKGNITILAGDGGSEKLLHGVALRRRYRQEQKYFLILYQMNLQSASHRKYCFSVARIP